MITNFRHVISIFVVVTICLSATCLYGQEPEDISPAEIAAKVGDHNIRVRTVMRFLNKNVGNQEQSFPDEDLIKAHALEHLVRRAIVRDFLVNKKRWAGENAIRLDIEQFEAQLKRADLTLADHLKKNNISREQFEFETGWRLSWETYLNRVLSDKVLNDYFERNRIKFDGTTMKVAHLLLNDESMSDQECREKLQQIKTRLTSNHWNGASWSPNILKPPPKTQRAR